MHLVETIILILGGLTAGMLGGLLGIGGGIVLMPLLRFYLEFPPMIAAGTSIAAVFFTTLGGSFRHYRLGHVPIRSLLPVVYSGALSALIFSLIFLWFTRRDRWLDLGTGLVFSLVALRMIWEGGREYGGVIRKETGGKEIRGSLSAKLTLGGISDLLPGILGIGTGAVLVPAFHFLLEAPIKIAIGSSLAAFSVNAFISAALKGIQGFVAWPAVLPLALGTVVGSNIGAMLNKRFPPTLLKVFFGMAFGYVSYQYIALFLRR